MAAQALEAEIVALFGNTELADKARQESAAKYADPVLLQRIRDNWTETRTRLRQHLIPFGEVRRMLRDAGCPQDPEEIGISRERLRLSYRQAYSIRRRFTVLDLLERVGLFNDALENLFGPKGVWS